MKRLQQAMMILGWVVLIGIGAIPMGRAMASVTACTPRTDWPVYIVHRGDTLYQISRRVGASLSQLMTANCLSNANRIYVGQRLYVPQLPTGTNTGNIGGTVGRTGNQFFSSLRALISLEVPATWYVAESESAVMFTTFPPAAEPPKAAWDSNTLRMTMTYSDADPADMVAWAERKKAELTAQGLQLTAQDTLSYGFGPAMRLQFVSGSGGILAVIYVPFSARKYTFTIEGADALAIPVIATAQPLNTGNSRTAHIFYFVSRESAVLGRVLSTGAARVQVAWELFNRPAGTNLVFEQVLADGRQVNVELPRADAFVPSKGVGVVAPMWEGSSKSEVLLQMRLIVVATGETLETALIRLPVR
jgi:LysM repeat protein